MTWNKDDSLSDKGSPGSEEKVIRGILHYCVEHPYAKDTPEGILKWWRLIDKSEWRKEDVQKALDALTAKGWLTKRNTSPPEKIYGFNKTFMEEIRKFLNESEKDKGD